MKKTTSLSARTNLFFLAGIAVFTLTLILILHISSGRLLYNWQKMETEAMHEYVEKTLSDLIAQSANPYKKISSTEINDALADFPYPPKRLIITDPDYNILYVYRQNRSGGAGRQMQNTMRVMQDISSWRPITNNSGRSLFFYHLRIPEFTETRSNHKLLKSFRLALSLATLVSFTLAFFASRFFSGGIKKQTNSLVAVLESIAEGKRDIVIPKSSIKEFSQIALAAETLQKNLLREETLRRQWSSDIAHDLRTPLTVLQGTLEGLLDGVFKVDNQKLKTIHTQVKHLSSLVNALSLLSKLETPDYVLHKETISLHDSLTNAVRFFSPQAKLKNINFITDIPKITINADPVLFERLISNLVSNAVEYGLPKTDISLRVHRTNTEEICLSLSNYAELTEEVLEHAFDRLYQGKTARTDTHSGLGLSIVQAIVKSHRWSIDMQYDEKEKKVTFCIIFI